MCAVLAMMMLPLALGATLERSFDKTVVQPGESLTITYTQSEGSSYGFIQAIPTGWTASDLSPDGNYRTYIDSGDSVSLTITAPSTSSTASFGGEYFVYPSTTYSPFSAVTVTVGEGGSTPPPSNNDSGDGDSSSFGIIGIVIAIGAGIYFLTKKN